MTPSPRLLPLEPALAALNAAGEETRLRLLGLLAETELTVSEAVAILGQSQPRVSRHLKLLVEAGLVERRREGAWAFFRLATADVQGEIARNVVSWLDPLDPVLAGDRARLAEVRQARADAAARYFADHASEWDEIRSLHVPEAQVEAAMREAVGEAPLRRLLDLGAGAGRMLELFAPQAEQAIGVDLSSAMLAVARGRLEEAGARNVQLRQGDIYALPIERNSCDLVIVHQVLHYLDDPGRALREAARALAPGGRLLVVDFAPHREEALRDAHAHRRLGFATQEISALLTQAGLEVLSQKDLAPCAEDGGKLTVSLWLARDPRIIADPLPRTSYETA
ncbi:MULTISPECIES: ArsR/SmtB family transcription factor [Methylosinus]|uniref:ArsR family transcriptional regulator n=1 Tax=Methylosinus trichosporium (strain ATCC 35070 / NCIMB 11131 / UNIQEM 75 / OB3b) TaxID=595536 RepID=A0A2D2D692_METT3|nr:MULTISPECIES: metalloregulator ArsR/SmtB family transcription factor [Methylosinus]ATQ70492.1 ArsR family transcriptional regulator [Methylosinus trichosporium OB3b]OBS52494.1 ArsR family transcriptional regulator [Methylosinus sp. 3S-1]